MFGRSMELKEKHRFVREAQHVDKRNKFFGKHIHLGSIFWLWILMSAWISRLMLMHSIFILRYAADIVIGSVRRLSLLLDKNSSVSIICLLHLLAAAFCKKRFLCYCLLKRINRKHGLVIAFAILNAIMLWFFLIVVSLHHK